MQFMEYTTYSNAGNISDFWNVGNIMHIPYIVSMVNIGNIRSVCVCIYPIAQIMGISSSREKYIVLKLLRTRQTLTVPVYDVGSQKHNVSLCENMPRPGRSM